MKKLIYALFAVLLATPLVVIAEEYINEAEIDLDSIRYNKSNNTAEIRVKIYNTEYAPGTDNLYYGMYYLKMDCAQKTYKPMIIEGYNKKDELMLVDYNERVYQQIVEGSDIEQAYNFACQIQSLPEVSKKNKSK